VPPPPGVSPDFVGFADLVIDAGGTLRRTLFWMDPPVPTGGLSGAHLCSGPETILSLSLQIALIYLSAENINPLPTDQGELQLGETIFRRRPQRFSGYQTPDPSGYQIMLNYRSARHVARQATLADVLEGRIQPEWVRDRIVLVGYNTPQAGDDFYTPYSQSLRDDQKMPGVMTHAQATSQILSAVLDGRPLIWAWPQWAEMGWLFSWSLVGGLLAWYIRQPWRLVLVGVGVASLLYGVCLLWMLQGGWIPLVPAVMALGISATSTITILNQRLKAENMRIRAELDVTRRLQQMILPPDEELNAVEGLDIAGYMDPCDEVGGDYYDVLSHNGQLKIGIGDVTGHGLESGLIMLMVQTAVRTLLESNETDTQKFLNLLNRTIYHNVQRINCGKTMTLSFLDYRQGTLYLSGQHEEVLLVRANGELEQIDTVNLGFPIALEEDIEDFVAQIPIHLNPGDLVVLYTDGITEAMNLDRDQYGLERLCDVVVKNHQRSVHEIKQCVIDDVLNFIGQQTIFDDITLVVIKQK
jgi:serine phosphatase RsbU (regulator of sigma subunit)